MTCPGHREAGARGEDQAGKPWRRKHTGTGKQPGTADELYGHDAGVCHAVALRMDGRAQLVAEGDRRTIAAAQVAAVIWSPDLGVLAVAAAGVLCAFCCLMDALPGQCLRRRPRACPLVAAVFRTKRLRRERCSATCQRRRRPGQARHRQGQLQITADLRGCRRDFDLDAGCTDLGNLRAPRARTSTECCRIAPSYRVRVGFLRITMAPRELHPDTYQRRRPRRGPRAATGAFLRSGAWVPGGSVLQQAGPSLPRSSHPHLPGRRDER